MRRHCETPPNPCRARTAPRSLHPFTPLRQFSSGEAAGRIVTGGSGIRIRDETGRELIDAFAGLYCVNVGYGRREIADAIHQQALQLAYYHAYGGAFQRACDQASRSACWR